MPLSGGRFCRTIILFTSNPKYNKGIYRLNKCKNWYGDENKNNKVKDLH